MNIYRERNFYQTQPTERAHPIPSLSVKYPTHLFELDVMRAFLSWWVVFAHTFMLANFQWETAPAVISIILHGDYAVDVFIMISGFVITKLLAEKKEAYGVFITRRLFRLYPAFFVATLAGIVIRPVISSILATNWTPLPNVYNAIWQSEGEHFWPHLLAHLSMLHGVIPDKILPYSSVAFLIPGWSLSLEFQYYLLAPIFVFIDRKFGPRGWLALIAGSVLVSHVFTSTIGAAYSAPSFLPQMLPFFLIGMTSYWIYVEAVRKHEDLSGRLLIGAAPLVCFLTKSISLTIWVTVFALLLGDTKSRGVANIKSLLNRPSLRYLGKISYSTFLIHIPLLWLAKGFVLHLAPKISSIGMVTSLLVIIIPSTFVASALLYRFVEKPGIDLGRRLLDRQLSPNFLPKPSTRSK